MKKLLKNFSILMFVAFFALAINFSFTPTKNGIAIHAGPTIAKADVDPGGTIPDVITPTTPAAITFETE